MRNIGTTLRFMLDFFIAFCQGMLSSTYSLVSESMHFGSGVSPRFQLRLIPIAGLLCPSS